MTAPFLQPTLPAEDLDELEQAYWEWENECPDFDAGFLDDPWHDREDAE